MAPAILQPTSATLYLCVGAGGVILGGSVLAIFTYRRARRRIDPRYRKKKPAPRRAVACCSLMSGVMLIPIGAALFFCGAFLQAYQAFSREEPVAQIITQPMETGQGHRLSLIQVLPLNGGKPRFFFLRGDQWTLEGDVVKWDRWLNFLGLNTHYRLTRIRGRYLDIEDEIKAPGSVYSLTGRENRSLWRYLYAHGHKLPFISTVYGNAVFQDTNANKRFTVYVSPSGFVVRSEDSSQARAGDDSPRKEPGNGSGGQSSHLSSG